MKKVFFVILLSAAVLTGMWFLVRDSLGRWIVEKKINSFCLSRQAECSIGKLGFVGIRTLEIRQFMLKPIVGDTLLTINKIEARVNLPELLLLRRRLSRLSIQGLKLNLQKQSVDSANYLFLFPKPDKINSTTEVSDSMQFTFYEKAGNILGAIFSYLPKETFLLNINVNANLLGESFEVKADSVFVKNRRFKTQIQLNVGDKQNNVNVEGKVSRRQKTFFCAIYKSSPEKVQLPYLKTRWGTRMEFDTLKISLDSSIYESEAIRLKLKSQINGLILENKRVSSKEVGLEKISLNLHVKFGNDFVCIDSTTSVEFNQIQFNPFIKYDRTENKILIIKVLKPVFDAQDLFSSLPRGLFYNLQGIKVKGGLSFRFYLQVDLNNPDSIEFDAILKRHDFSVTQFGNTDFRMLNNAFEHVVYENDDTAAIIVTDVSNPQFVSLGEISPYLWHSIITSEDGQYFTHKGFIPDEIKNAIVANIKNKKFARGASTISMQLVKNVFLNHNKTITRKLEEALITWLIESQNWCSKDRMLEIYLNIIEMGPGVYGVKQGAQYYFNKDVSDITLSEALFISSIVPRPKKFKYLFGPDLKLKPVLAGYFRFVSGKMLERGYITQTDYDSLKPEVCLTGPARYLLTTPVDSIATDSTGNEIWNLMEPQ